MQQEQVPTVTTQPATERRLADDLREFARQHRELARKNYEAFTKAYGKPSDRVKELQARLRAGWLRTRAEARDGYTKLDRDLAAKSQADPSPVVVKTTNGASGH